MPLDESVSKRPSSPARSGPRRSPGTGSLFIACDLGGRETYYGTWRVGCEQIKRRIGPKRIRSTRERLTRTQAEAELRRMMSTLQRASTMGGRITVAEGGALLIESITAKGRKRATIHTYESHIRVHLAPFFTTKRLDRIGRREIQAFVRHMTRTGRSTKTTFNALAVLHGAFERPDARSGCSSTRARSSTCRAQQRPTRTSTASISRRSRRSCAPSPMTTSVASSARCTPRPR